MNMLTKSFEKFIQRKRIYCEHNPACLCYGTHVVQRADGSILLYCDKHTNQVTNSYSLQDRRTK